MAGIFTNWKIKRINKGIKKLEGEIKEQSELLEEQQKKMEKGGLTEDQFKIAEKKIHKRIRTLKKEMKGKKKARKEIRQKIREAEEVGFFTGWKIKRINRAIAKLELRIEKQNGKLLAEKKKMEDGDITKAQFQRARLNISTKIRGLNTSITRKKKARNIIEKEAREKEEEKEKEKQKAKEQKNTEAEEPEEEEEEEEE